jgi:hypothetical protein
MGHLRYSCKATKEIAKLFKDTQVKVAFQKRNMIQNLVKPCSQVGRYEESGIYQMKCMDWPLKYIGQTGGIFYTIYKEHIQAITE